MEDQSGCSIAESRQNQAVDERGVSYQMTPRGH